MAHSIRYWYDVMIAEKETMANIQDLQPNIDSSQQLLTDLNTTSRVGVWRLILWIVATAAYALEIVFDLFKTDLEEISKRSRYGTLPWYAYISKKYQQGDVLVFNNEAYEYAVPDPGKQIIKRVAVSEAGPSVLIKVAKLAGNTPVKLDALELSSFTYYINDEGIKPAGIVVNIISDDADLLKIYVKVKYDPLVMAADGSLIDTPSVFPVNLAIEEFISNLPFDGLLELCDLVDAIQLSEGVDAVYLLSAAAKYGAYSYQNFSESYSPYAGYLKIDTANFPLNNTITYVANA